MNLTIVNYWKVSLDKTLVCLLFIATLSGGWCCEAFSLVGKLSIIQAGRVFHDPGPGLVEMVYGQVEPDCFNAQCWVNMLYVVLYHYILYEPIHAIDTGIHALDLVIFPLHICIILLQSGITWVTANDWGIIIKIKWLK